VLAAAPAGTETARVVAESGGGEVADPGDPTGFAAAALRLLGDPERRRAYAASARAWARRSFRLPDIADRFQQVL
jgi:glycosyltransferase involved in cell wall biosynthesis